MDRPPGQNKVAVGERWPLVADSGKGPGGPGPPPPPPYLKVWIHHCVGTVIDIIVVCKT